MPSISLFVLKLWCVNILMCIFKPNVIMRTECIDFDHISLWAMFDFSCNCVCFDTLTNISVRLCKCQLLPYSNTGDVYEIYIWILWKQRMIDFTRKKTFVQDWTKNVHEIMRHGAFQLLYVHKTAGQFSCDCCRDSIWKCAFIEQIFQAVSQDGLKHVMCSCRE